jgi:tRNA threonylcarbamoyladenosine biosynthesis protein TsaE
MFEFQRFYSKGIKHHVSLKTITDSSLKMKITFECSDPAELTEAAEILTSYFKEDRVVAFYGAMGAGKTTFIRAICKELGTTDTVSSPTYGLVNEYALRNGKKIYHFDFYRISSLEEAIAMGVDDYLNSGEWCLVEWPERIEALLPARYVKVTIEEEQEVRTIRMQNHSGNVSLGD